MATSADIIDEAAFSREAPEKFGPCTEYEPGLFGGAEEELLAPLFPVGKDPGAFEFEEGEAPEEGTQEEVM